MEDIYEKNYEKCDYCNCSYREWDTEYPEYECELVGGQCMGGYIDSGCPLSFKYSVEEAKL